MRVSDGQVAALRAFLIHDPDRTVPLTAQLGDEGMPSYQSLADAALSVVAGRRFSPRFTSADLVRYVASVRVSRMVDGDEYDFDPRVGENVLRYALGQDIRITPDPEERFRWVERKLRQASGLGVDSPALRAHTMPRVL